MKKRVAIVYDRANKWGGAERVLLALHKIFPDAPLFTSVYDPKSASWAKVFPFVKTSFLQRIPLARLNHEFFGLIMPMAFGTFDFSDYDIVISVTSESAKAIKTSKDTLHICYCLTPTRYLWSGYEIYFPKGTILRFLGDRIIKYLRVSDRKYAKNPDVIVGISREVADRVLRFYKRKAILIHPPVTGFKGFGSSKNRKYYLIVSRLVSYKRVDLAISVFNQLRYPLIVVGKGREMSKLKKKASKNIKFVGQVSEKKLANYYSNAKALIMPQEEDFGIVSLEAQAYGLPVIAYAKGGSRDTVLHGKTGILFHQQNEKSLLSAIKKFEKTTFRRADFKENVDRFSYRVFKTKLLDLIKKVIE